MQSKLLILLTDTGLFTRFMPTKYHHFAYFRLSTYLFALLMWLYVRAYNSCADPGIFARGGGSRPDCQKIVLTCFSSPEPLAHGTWAIGSWWAIVVVGCPSSVVCRPSSTIASNDNSSLTTGWIFTKLGRNDPFMTLSWNCSNGSSPLHI